MNTHAQKIRAIIRSMRRFLSKRCPPKFPTTIHVGKINIAADGFTRIGRGRAMIVIDYRVALSAVELLLIHEWAHAMDGGPGHGRSWGACVSRIHTAIDKTIPKVVVTDRAGRVAVERER